MCACLFMCVGLCAFADAQLGIFKSGVQSRKMGTSHLFNRSYGLRILFFRFIRGEYCGMFTDIVVLKTNDSYCYFLSWQGRKKGAGAKPPENLWNHAFSIFGKRPFDMKITLQKGYSCSFAEKGRDLDPQVSP